MYTYRLRRFKGCFTIRVHRPKNAFCTSIKKVNALLSQIWYGKLMGTVCATYKSEETVRNTITPWKYLSTSQNMTIHTWWAKITVSLFIFQFWAGASPSLAIIRHCFTNQNWLLKWVCFKTKYPESWRQSYFLWLLT